METYHIRKCLFPKGDYVLMAMVGERMLCGVVAHPKNGPAWMRSSITKADRERVAKAVKEEYPNGY